jgi:hypothetical protein
MKSPILGGSYVARSTNAADARMVNLYAEATAEGGKEAGFLSRCPGLSARITVGDGPIRGLWTYGGNGYVVSGLELYKIAPDYTSTLLGSVTGTGPVSMTDNGTQLFVACNGPGFIYNANTNVFSVIGDPDFAGAVNVGFIDGYFVFTQPNSQIFWVTTLYDGTSVDPLDFASAEGSPDGIVSMIVDHREVWMLGTNSVEVWYDAGNTDFPLARIQGAYNEVGCAATFSVAKLDNGIFWLGSDARGNGIVYRSKGYAAVRISTSAIEYAIQNYATISDAIAYTYQEQGHTFYVLTFPSADATWAYDASTDLWHERAGWGPNGFMRHRSNCQMNFGNEIIVGDFETGKLYALDLHNYTDDGVIQKWLRSWRAIPTGQNDLKRTAQHSLQLDMEVGAYNDLVDFVPPAPVGGMVLRYFTTEAASIIEFTLNGGSAPLNATVDWGDGAVDTFTADGTYSHENMVGGEVLVTITGTCPQFISGTGFIARLIEIVSWDDALGLEVVDISDSNPENPVFVGVPANLPTTLWRVSFFNCYVFNDANVVSWDTSNLTSMGNMFNGANTFNQDISGWNTSAVGIMFGMFQNAFSFDQNIGAWNTSSVYDMGSMFSGATAFNQDISGWDMTQVVYTNNMFEFASAFNQPIGAWTFTMLEDASYMFLDATVFNQDLSGWCVTNIPSLPTDFDTGSALTAPHLPVWGTCPP